MRLDGYESFASALEYGEITCSSVFPKGHILTLSIVKDQQLANICDDLSLTARNHVREQCQKAVRILRKIGIYNSDAGKQNVLYSTTSGAVTTVDLEMAGVCTEEEIPVPLAPELLCIFGEAVMREPGVGVIPSVPFSCHRF